MDLEKTITCQTKKKRIENPWWHGGRGEKEPIVEGETGRLPSKKMGEGYSGRGKREKKGGGKSVGGGNGKNSLPLFNSGGVNQAKTVTKNRHKVDGEEGSKRKKNCMCRHKKLKRSKKPRGKGGKEL